MASGRCQFGDVL